jgi:epoxyqueuosine reductase
LHAPELIPLLALDQNEFRRRFSGSPILRAKRRGFLRNVAVALGNTKSREAIPALIRALDDDEPLVRGHAAWALGQIGSQPALDALKARRRIENDGEVCDEIADAIRTVSAIGESTPRN